MQKQQLAIKGGIPLFKEPVTYPWPLITKEMEDAVIKQMHTALSIYKRKGVVAEFEDMFAGICGGGYALVTNSGTNALHSAFYGLGIGPDDEVICQNYTFFASAVPLFQLGALPVLADCDELGGLDPQEIERLLTPKTKAVVITHMWGNPCDMDAIVGMCKKHNLKLVEDCSHAHGATYNGKMVGTFGDAAAWSMQTQKIIAAGEGGVLFTKDREVYDRAQLLGHFNKRAMEEMDKTSSYYQYATTGTGLKYRAHPLGVAIALTQLPYLKEWMKGKQINAKKIKAIVESQPGINVIEQREKSSGAYYAFTFLVDEEKLGCSREQLVNAIIAEGFEDIDIPKAMSPLHTFALFNKPTSPVIEYSDSCVRGEYKNSEMIAKRIVKLSVPVEYEAGSRGDIFIDKFKQVWNKVFENGI